MATGDDNVAKGDDNGATLSSFLNKEHFASGQKILTILENSKSEGNVIAHTLGEEIKYLLTF